MQTGFSLIELLIVLVVIVVLASIAEPQYNFGEIARVDNSITMTENITVRIGSYARTNKRLPDNINATFFKLPDNDKTLESVTWHPEQSALLIAFKPAEVLGDGKYIVLFATGAVDNLQWHCSNKHALIVDKPMPDAYLPGKCRTLLHKSKWSTVYDFVR